MSLTKQITQHVANTTFQDLTADEVEAVKHSIVDTLACMLAATSNSDSQERIHSALIRNGGNGESTLIASRSKAPALEAAFLNGTLTHALDFDDTTDQAPHHPTANTLPTALALAEQQDASGDELVLAVATGNDISVRLAAGPDGSSNMDYPFLPITLFGLWGSVTAASKILRLDQTEIQNAFGLGLHQASGVTEGIFSPQSDLRSYRDAFTNRNGTLAATLAKAGVRAVRDTSLEIFFSVYYQDQYSRPRVLDDLGQRNLSSSVSLKPWPSDRETHGYIEAILDLVKTHSISAEQVENVTLTVGRFGRDHLCEPLEIKRRPELSIGAKLSLPYIAAVAITRSKVAPSDFSPSSLNDPDVMAMCRRVSYEFDESYGNPPGTGTPARVRIRLRDGSELVNRVDTLLGHPARPMSRAQVEDKFRACAEFAGVPIAPSRLDQLLAQLWTLETLPSVRDLMSLLGESR